MVVAAFAEEAVVNDAVDVQLIEERIAILERISRSQDRWRYRVYLRDRSRENNHFIEFSNPTHELVNTRALDDIDVVVLIFNLDWDREVCLVENLVGVSAD